MKNDGEMNKEPLHTKEEIKELMESFSVNSILKHKAYQNKPLDFETAYILGCFALLPYKEAFNGSVGEEEKDIAEKQSLATLCSLHNTDIYKKAKAPEQIAGICASIFDHDIGMSEYGFLEPQIEDCMDNCGMGGDLYRTPNVSTIAALLAAADGIPICKHGSPGNTDSTGSSDFIKHCGVYSFPDKETVKQGLENFCFGYTDALDTGYKSIHKQTHESAGLAHMNDIIGPITNPVHPSLMKRRVLGINHLIEPKVVAETYQILNEKGITNLEKGLFVRGFVTSDREGGIDEVSVFEGGTKVAQLEDGIIKEYDLYASDFGTPTQKYTEPPTEKSQYSYDILKGAVEGPSKDLILVNAAILYYLSRKCSFQKGFREAENTLESQHPLHNLEQYISSQTRSLK